MIISETFLFFKSLSWLYFELYVCSAREFGTYSVGERWRFRSVCTYTQTHQSLCCFHTQSIDVDVYAQTKIKTSSFAGYASMGVN